MLQVITLFMSQISGLQFQSKLHSGYVCVCVCDQILKKGEGLTGPQLLGGCAGKEGVIFFGRGAIVT